MENYPSCQELSTMFYLKYCGYLEHLILAKMGREKWLLYTVFLIFSRRKKEQICISIISILPKNTSKFCRKILFFFVGKKGKFHFYLFLAYHIQGMMIFFVEKLRKISPQNFSLFYLFRGVSPRNRKFTICPFLAKT